MRTFIGALLISFLCSNYAAALSEESAIKSRFYTDGNNAWYLCVPYSERHNLGGPIMELVRSYQEATPESLNIDVQTNIQKYQELKRLQLTYIKACEDFEEIEKQSYDRKKHETVEENLLDIAYGLYKFDRTLKSFKNEN